MELTALAAEDQYLRFADLDFLKGTVQPQIKSTNCSSCRAIYQSRFVLMHCRVFEISAAEMSAFS